MSVTCLANSTALDIVAIGLSDGRIVLHNLKYDKTLFTFTHSPGPVTALSFRTGKKMKNTHFNFIISDNEACLASGNGKGDIAIWDLEKRKLLVTLKDVHSSITTIQFMPNDFIMITSGDDNTIKVVYKE